MDQVTVTLLHKIAIRVYLDVHQDTLVSINIIKAKFGREKGLIVFLFFLPDCHTIPEMQRGDLSMIAQRSMILSKRLI